MTHLELVREARAIVPPVGADKAIVVVDEQLKHRAAFLVNGRRRSDPVGPAFDKPSAACAFVDLLNGHDRPASRSSLDSDSVPRSGFASSGDAGGATSEVPDSQAGTSALDPAAIPPAAGVRTCEGCHKPLPAGSRSHRRTDTDACRRALGRREAEAGRVDVVGVRTDVPLSRASDAPALDPTAREAERGPLLRSASRDAGPDLSGIEDPAVPTFGL